MNNYIKFIREKGRSMIELNPGSDEYALNVNDALVAIDLLEIIQQAVLGGDVLSDKSGKLRYEHENWYTQKLDSENQTEYVKRSYDVARDYIAGVVRRGDENRYIVLVV